jgi:hypothetical protein
MATRPKKKHAPKKKPTAKAKQQPAAKAKPKAKPAARAKTKPAPAAKSALTPKQKIDLVLSAYVVNADRYGNEAPRRLLDFWRKGEVFSYDRKCIPGGAFAIPGWGDGSKRLNVALPFWEVHGERGGLDSGIVGPDGDWKEATHFFPLFHVDSSRYVVANIDDPSCPVGFFDEEHWRDHGRGYVTGVYMLTKSLDEFLAKLVDRDTAEFETMVRDWSFFESQARGAGILPDDYDT